MIAIFKYKIDVINALKNAGYSSYRIESHHILSSSTMQKLRNGNTDLSLKTIDTICSVLKCTPYDILIYIPDTNTDTEQKQK